MTIYAFLRNPTEEWSCPTVAWIAPDGTVATRTSDCDPETTPETIWSRSYRLSGPCSTDGVIVPCEFSVELRRNDKVLARKSISVTVR